MISTFRINRIYFEFENNGAYSIYATQKFIKDSNQIISLRLQIKRITILSTYYARKLIIQYVVSYEQRKFENFFDS